MTRGLGIDVGSTTTKAALVVVTGDGGVEELAVASRPTPDTVSALVAAVLACVRELLDGEPTPVDAVGVASMAETGAVVDADGAPRTALLRWDAGHGAADAERLAPRAADVFAATGVRLAAKTPLATWAWLLQEQPHAWPRTARWLGAADLVVHALTGRSATDHTLAGRTGGHRPAPPGSPGAWDPDLLALAGVMPDRLPPVLAPTDTAGVVLPEAARSTGLRAGTPVAVAGHDHHVAAWALGAREPGKVVDSVGTAEAVLGLLGRRPDPEAVRAQGMSIQRTVAGDVDVLVAGSGAAGAMLTDWLSTVPLGRQLDVLEEAARQRAADPRPTGAAAPPYLRGRQSPVPDPLATAGEPPSGWPWHRQAVAVVEGLAYQTRWMVRTQAELGVEPRELTVVAPARLPRVWSDVRRAVLPWPLAHARAQEPVAAGAGLLALVRAGHLGDVATALREGPTLTRHPAEPAGWDHHAAAFEEFVRTATG